MTRSRIAATRPGQVSRAAILAGSG